MKEINNRRFYKFCRFCVRGFTPRYSTCPSNSEVSPAVYIVHHQNMRGPILSMAWAKAPLRPWVLSVFCKRITCFRQFFDYTFTKRFSMPKLIAAVFAFPLSFFVSALMTSMQAIPVFRGSKDIVKTFKESTLTLENGQNVLICPDIDYTDTSSNVGQMYNGFLDLEKYYKNQTGSHLAFVPLHISKNKHIIYEGEAVYFKSEENFKQGKDKVYCRLEQEFLLLENKSKNT